MGKKMTFALAFCNRGFMPGELIYGAREDMIKAVTDAGYDYIAMDAELTRFGGIETRDEGLLYAKWLKEHEGQFDGVIYSMPIFADENGAITALQDAGVPILMQAYPDGLQAPPRRLLRQVLRDRRVHPVRRAVHGVEAPRRPPAEQGV